MAKAGFINAKQIFLDNLIKILKKMINPLMPGGNKKVTHT